MIQSITFTEKWRCFEPGDKFDFVSGVNLLVGDQGCGKSSLMSAIRNNSMKLSIQDRDWSRTSVANVITNGKTDCFKFDFEKDSYRSQKAFGVHAMLQVASGWLSHGESNRIILNNLNGVKGSVIFMDEPDMALSIRSIYALIKQIKRWAKDGNQIILAVHNPIMIESFTSVLSLEHHKWMSSDSFVWSHKEEA